MFQKLSHFGIIDLFIIYIVLHKCSDYFLCKTNLVFTLIVYKRHLLINIYLLPDVSEMQDQNKSIKTMKFLKLFNKLGKSILLYRLSHLREILWFVLNRYKIYLSLNSPSGLWFREFRNFYGLIIRINTKQDTHR